MADLVAATITQLKNIQARSGKTVAELHAAIATSGAVKHAEKRGWLMAQFGLGYGDANTVVHFIDKPMPDLDGGVGSAVAAAPEREAADPLDAIYTGAKAALRPLHLAAMALMQDFGDFEVAPKKTYISLRRKRQFATLGPATKDSVEIGFNARDLPPHPRLKPLPPGSMCHASTRLTGLAEVDAELKAWLRRAYDTAG